MYFLKTSHYLVQFCFLIKCILFLDIFTGKRDKIIFLQCFRGSVGLKRNHMSQSELISAPDAFTCKSSGCVEVCDTLLWWTLHVLMLCGVRLAGFQGCSMRQHSVCWALSASRHSVYSSLHSSKPAELLEYTRSASISVLCPQLPCQSIP